jgi:hypothetical protein
MAKNKGLFKLKQTSKTLDLPSLIRASDILYQKEIDSATGNGDQSKTPEADDASFNPAKVDLHGKEGHT